ncbi:SdrD B-like domain-containing protein [Chloroflexus aggregans]|uniref:Cna B domain protein n=1 Tax=Chloroflexus aggregans (strain MD-66 / DSM 9485) TaxID=326427 RepID=B8G2T5_CHLAD|nr:SdrD B-like domain-containing protein [Chloroflexus aggregans]ACL23239.1 Cna B domain protein [Chloroflexus aggregans DSM 9485]
MSQHSSVLIPHLYRRKRGIISLILALLIVSTLFSAAITVFAAGTLTVHVYTDTNRNGLDDDGPGNGIAGVLVSVYTADSVLVGLNTTDSNGDVVFPALPNGEYRIEVSNLGARVVSVPGTGNAGLLSFVTISGSAVTQRVGLRPATPTDNDAPIGTRSVVARVWDDRDADGVQDAGEPGLSGIPVQLIDSLGNLVAGPVNTDIQGRAIFNTAPTGAGYRLRILAANIPGGYILTQAFVNDGAPNPGIRDSEAVLVGGNVEATLPNTGRGVNVDSIDIGFARGAVSGFVWRDTNRNGLWDPGEPRLSGVQVQLLNTTTSTVVDTTTTRQRLGSSEPSDGGIFVFTGIPLGATYQVVIPVSQFASGTTLFGAANSPNASGGDVGAPDGVPSGDVTGPSFSLTSGSNTRNDQLFGFYKGVVGDYVWLDDNGNGSPDSGEIGVNGVIVFVDDGRGSGSPNNGIRDGGEISTVTTNNPSNGQPGYFSFDDLPLGVSYRIVLDESNFLPGGALVGLGNSTGTQATNGNGNTYVYRDSISLNTASPEDTNVDFGLTRVTIGNFVFEDANADGRFSSGEQPIPNVTVRTYRASDNLLLGTAVSNSSGIYTIPGLPAEEIYVTFDISTAGAGYIGFVGSIAPSGTTIDPSETTYTNYSDLTANVGGDVWRTDSFTPTPGTSYTGIDAGFYRPAKIVVRLFGETVNINNTPETGEPGIGGVAVTVTNTVTSETTTLTTNNVSGDAIFELPPGSYTVTVPTPSGYLPSPGNSGSISFPNLLSQNVVNADFGYYRPGQISGVTFFDANKNSTADSGEPRMRNVTVELLDSSSSVVTTTTTSSSGTYSFTNLLPGTYTVRFTNPDTGNYVFITGGDSDVTTGGAVATSSTATLAVPYNGSLTNIDAGFRGQTTVSGRVFEDNNGDNLQDAGDTDLTGATVTLTVTANLPNLVATFPATITTTPPNYQFTELPGGNTGTITYTITFAPPTGGYIASDANVGGDDAIDSDGPTVTVTGPAPGSTLDFDQGYYRNVTITARVFREPSAGRNNQWDSGENGITGVQVWLERLDSTRVQTATTTTGGLVTFTVRPGSYQLNVDESSPALSGLQPSSGSTAAIPVVGSPLSSGGSSLTETSPPGTTHVFGFFTFGTVSGRVFFDGTTGPADNLATGEPGVSGVMVQLLDAGGNPISGKTATTDSNGNFTITDVEGGTYRLEFVNPAAANFSFVAANTGDNNVATIVSDNGRTDTFTVTDGQTTTRNAAIIGRSTVNGVTFVDRAYDGQRVGDPGLAGVTVTLNATINLSNVSTTITRTTTSDSNGIFSFTGLPGGTSTSEASFSLTFTPPSATPHYQVTLADQGDNATDSDDTAELTNQPIGINTTASRDQGYYQNVTIRARVFNETVTINNSFESGEPGLRAVSVSVSGPVSGSQFTDLSGIVTFNGPPGTYTFTVPTDPSGYLRSPGNSGTASTGLVLSGQTPDPVPFGYYRPAQISGTVWFDVNRNGLFDSGEPGMENISVTLNGNSSGPRPPVPTDDSGSFTITNIEPTGLTNTSYQLCFALPAGFAFTSLGDTLTTDNNSDANLTTGCTTAFSVASNANITYLDAGMVGTLSIGDLVWEDINANGIQESGEQALDGVTITVTVATTGNVINATNPSFTFSTTSTTATGLAPNYTIDNIPPGSTVTIQSVSRFGYVLSPANQGSNSSVDSNAIGESITLTTSNTTIDFGLYRTTAIGNLVWFDANGNGLRDTGEPGIGGITVALRNSSGATVTTTTTLGDGSYAFNNVTPGTYSLQITLPAGYTTTNNGSGSVTVDDDNDVRTDGTTANFTILSGQAIGSVDAGLRGIGGVSGIAWFDTNENNQRDPAETERLAGVQVTITYTPTLLAAYEQTVQTTTDTNGAYSITGLPPGQVTVTFTDRKGYLPAQPNIGDDATDSDGPVVTFTLTAGQQAVVDMGYYKRVLVYLPMTIVQIPPDLIVTVQATPTSPNKNTPVTYRVTVTNIGREPAGNFWVDLYVNPSRPPNVNERWNDLSRQGLAWFFDGTLQPGESITLISLPRSTTNPLGYDPGTSSPTWNGRLPPGRNTIYVYVDSWNRSITGDVVSPFGAVEEVNETNNRAEIMIMVSE